MPNQPQRRYGWRRDLPDHRDYMFASAIAPLALPPVVDLRPFCTAVYDQGQLGSCTANAIAGAVDMARKVQGETEIDPSRLFIYYNERSLEGTVPYDAGAMIRDGIKSLGTWGVAREADWPYDITQFTVQPPDPVYQSALAEVVSAYLSVPQDLNMMRACLAQQRSIICGITVYSSFESQQVASTGIAPMPGWFERPLGGHAVLCVGYNDPAQTFLMRNSWGPGWGQAGYFTIPYGYLTNRFLAGDFWTLQTVP